MFDPQRAGAMGQRHGGELIAARRAADAEIDAYWKQCFQHAEIFRHLERTVMAQHHAAGPDADGFGPRGHLADHDFRRRAGNPVAGMMFRQPITMIAPFIGRFGESQGFMDGVGRGHARPDRDLIEYAE